VTQFSAQRCLWDEPAAAAGPAWRGISRLDDSMAPGSRQRLRKNRDGALRDPELAMHLAFAATSRADCQGFTMKMLRALETVHAV
jgi:hypothetical protein